MAPAPSRLLQLTCAAVTLVGIAPWIGIFDAVVLNAIESKQPLAMSVVAWLVLLVPLWVALLAAVAWRERDISLTPALLMAMPAMIIGGLRWALPLADLAR